MGTQHQKLQIVVKDKKIISKKPGAKDEWRTPKSLFRWVSKYYDFTLDAAATDKNALCKKYYTKEADAFRKNWFVGSKGGDVWLNHPYSQNLEWIMKCAQETKRGTNIVNLGPCDTSAQWFGAYYNNCTTIYLFSGRIKFRGAKSYATFANALYIFGHDKLASKHNRDKKKIALLELSPTIRGGTKHGKGRRKT